MTAGKAAIRWCAVYTRKSSDDGLEQEFNSLHAQREAAPSSAPPSRRLGSPNITQKHRSNPRGLAATSHRR
jgi:hypothetical protein